MEQIKRLRPKMNANTMFSDRRINSAEQTISNDRRNKHFGNPKVWYLNIDILEASDAK